MARARNIKPGFFESEDPAKVGYPQRLLWIALWTLADREGRLEYRPARIKKYAFGFDTATVGEVGSWVRDLHNAGLIVLYPVGSVEVIQCVHFLKHQKPHHKDPPSEFPPPSCMEQIPGKVPHGGGISPGIPRIAGTFPGKVLMEGPTPREIPGKVLMHEASPGTFPGKPPMEEASPRLNVECGMLNVEGGRGKGALPPAPPPAKTSLLPFDDGPDPQAELNAVAVEIVGKLPAGGSVSLTAKALEYKWHASDTTIEEFCRFVRSRADEWREAWDENPDMRRKQAHYWIGDGDYKAAAPQKAKVAAGWNGKPKFEPMKPSAKGNVCATCGGVGTVLTVPFEQAMRMDSTTDVTKPCPECVR